MSSIEYVRTDEYFDLHVPIAEHYLAEGIWHHNTGKTFSCLFKLHTMLLAYPGSRALVARKTNTALAGSAMVTFREMLDPREGVVYFGGSKVRPAAFHYPNGSELVVNGLDKPEKIKSTAFDLALLNEATDGVTLEDWEFVRSRLRHGKMPYHQLIADVNPVEPSHWLNCRMNEGRTTRLLSRFEDNPRYYNPATQDWTEEGRFYIEEVLGGLTGVRLARLRYGIWSQAEGTIFEGVWDRAVNVVDRYPIKPDYPRFLSIDYGFTNPFVCLWAAIDPDGRIIIYRQLYKTRRLVEDHAIDILLASGWYHLLPRSHPKYSHTSPEWADPLPREVICDTDAEDRRTFEKYAHLYTTAAHKTVSDGIQAVATRLRPAGDGKPRLLILRNSLIERDEELARMKRPLCLEDEMDVYIWKKGADGVSKEEPLKENDHAEDALRYLVARFDLAPGEVTTFRGIWR